MVRVTVVTGATEEVEEEAVDQEEAVEEAMAVTFITTHPPHIRRSRNMCLSM